MTVHELPHVRHNRVADECASLIIREMPDEADLLICLESVVAAILHSKFAAADQREAMLGILFSGIVHRWLEYDETPIS